MGWAWGWGSAQRIHRATGSQPAFRDHSPHFPKATDFIYVPPSEPVSKAPGGRPRSTGSAFRRQSTLTMRSSAMPTSAHTTSRQLCSGPSVPIAFACHTSTADPPPLLTQAVQTFLLAIKHERDPNRKMMLQIKTKELLDRAERIKDYLETQNAKKDASDGGGGGGAGGGGGGAGGAGVRHLMAGSGREWASFVVLLFWNLQRVMHTPLRAPCVSGISATPGIAMAYLSGTFKMCRLGGFWHFLPNLASFPSMCGIKDHSL